MKRDEKIVKFQERLPSYVGVEDSNYHSSNAGISYTKGDYDIREHRGMFDVDDDRLKCPICNKVSDFKVEHGDGYRCGKCGGFIRTYGAVIFIWNSEKYPTTLKELRLAKLKELNNNLSIVDKLKNIFI